MLKIPSDEPSRFDPGEEWTSVFAMLDVEFFDMAQFNGCCREPNPLRMDVEVIALINEQDAVIYAEESLVRRERCAWACVAYT